VDESFKLSNTIFKTLPEGSLLAKVQQTKLNTVLDWDPEAQREIEAEYSSVTLPPSGDEAIHQFMFDECHFDSEHADGSFFEHLHFCRDFTALHYPGGSPRVMLLHSICGVGTNAFPLPVEKMPDLAKLITPAEMTQVEAFPSVLRLLVHGPLLQQLSEMDAAQLNNIRSIKMHRVIDNAPLKLDAAQLFEALHCQLIHSIDFLPAAAWQRTSNEFMFHIFTTLHELVSKAGKLEANVSWDNAWMKRDQNGARPDTWKHWLVDVIPSGVVRKMAAKQVKQYSADIGHSLEYTLEFGDAN
jgi:hypothetical protein